MTLSYSRFVTLPEHDAADRYGLRAGFRGRRVHACDHSREIKVDQVCDAWDDLAFAAPLRVRAGDSSQRDSKAYILHKESDGAWFLDRWTADGAGAPRAPVHAMPAPSGEQNNTCFIIEISCASR